MVQPIKIATLCAALTLAGCISPLFQAAPPSGATLAEVLGRLGRLGRPTSIYPLAQGQLYEYATGPMGQFTWMAQIDADGRLASYEQVLTGEKFATIKVDHASKDDVLHTIGRPAERSRVAMHNYEVWSYRYKEAGVWNSLMHVHFDQNGIVRQMMNGPDPLFEAKDRRP